MQILSFIYSNVWKAIFGRQADSLEKSTVNEDECNFPSTSSELEHKARAHYSCHTRAYHNLTLADMIIDSQLLVNKYISTPKVSLFHVLLSLAHVEYRMLRIELVSIIDVVGFKRFGMFRIRCWYSAWCLGRLWICKYFPSLSVRRGSREGVRKLISIYCLSVSYVVVDSREGNSTFLHTRRCEI